MAAVQTPMTDEAVIQEILKRMGIQGRITLDGAKRLIDKIEQEAKRRGKNAVIAVCGRMEIRSLSMSWMELFL